MLMNKILRREKQERGETNIEREEQSTTYNVVKDVKFEAHEGISEELKELLLKSLQIKISI